MTWIYENHPIVDSSMAEPQQKTDSLSLLRPKNLPPPAWLAHGRPRYIKKLRLFTHVGHSHTIYLTDWQ